MGIPILIAPLLLGLLFGWGPPEILVRKTPETCAALTIYKEARSESEKGQEAVLFVTMGRAKDNLSDFGGNSICNVISHKTIRTTDRKVVYEFSWFGGFIKDPENARLWRLGFFKIPRDKRAWEKALRIAHAGLTGKIVVPPKLAKGRYFLNEAVSGHGGRCFFRGLVFLQDIGRHDFYRRPFTVADAVHTSRTQERCLKSTPPHEKKVVMKKSDHKKKRFVSKKSSKKKYASKKSKNKKLAGKKSKNKKCASKTSKKKAKKT